VETQAHGLPGAKIERDFIIDSIIQFTGIIFLISNQLEVYFGGRRISTG
jgi:hypothetical protein